MSDITREEGFGNNDEDFFAKTDVTPKKEKTNERKRSMTDEITPIKKIKAGESLIDQKLLIVGFEHKKFPPKKDADDYLYVSNIIGTDGKNNFIQLTIWGALHSKRLAEIFTEDSIGQTYFFENLSSVLPSNSLYNMGSVIVQLKWQDNSTVKKLTKEDEQIKDKDAVQNFYSFLSEKHSLSEVEKKENCKKLQSLKGGESNCLIIGQLVGISDVAKRGYDAYSSCVSNIMIAGSMKSAKISAWNLHAHLIRHIFQGKEGSTVILKVTAVKMDDGVLTVTWDVNTKYCFVNTPSEIVATSLQELVGIGGHAEVNLQLVFIKKPCFIDSNKETKMAMVSDGFHKAQIKIPADMKLKEQFHLTKAGILWTADNVLTLNVFSSDDVKDVLVAEDYSDDQLSTANLDYPFVKEENDD